MSSTHGMSWLLRACCVLVCCVLPGATVYGVQASTQSAEPEAGDDPVVLLGTSAAEPVIDDTPDGKALDDQPIVTPVLDGALQQHGFAAAVDAYRQGDYAEALELFGLLAAGDPDPERRAMLHANAGTAAARAGSLGQAVWHLEAALRCAPRDSTARRNLDQVRTRLGQPSLSAGSFTESLARLPLWLSPAESGQLLGVLGAVALVLLCLRRRWPRVGPRGALAVCALGLAFFFAWDKARAHDLDRAVVVAAAQVRAEPREEGKLLFRLDLGTVVNSRERRGDWQLVETDGGGRGWAPGEAIKLAGF
ncbi:MAG: hypothetical protein ACI9EF_001605 [Pseudohongiellaceae bacterium]|jgi:hypothetical protein